VPVHEPQVVTEAAREVALRLASSWVQWQRDAGALGLPYTFARIAMALKQLFEASSAAVRERWSRAKQAGVEVEAMHAFLNRPEPLFGKQRHPVRFKRVCQVADGAATPYHVRSVELLSNDLLVRLEDLGWFGMVEGLAEFDYWTRVALTEALGDKSLSDKHLLFMVSVDVRRRFAHPLHDCPGGAPPGLWRAQPE
jgi:hypothetical protein